MKFENIASLKQELAQLDREEILKLCLLLAKFNVENKEYLSFLLFDNKSIDVFVAEVIKEIKEGFEEMNDRSLYIAMKQVRAVLKTVKKWVKFSKDKRVEVELLLVFCFEMSAFMKKFFSYQFNGQILRVQMVRLNKLIMQLHEDLQYDYGLRYDEIIAIELNY